MMTQFQINTGRATPEARMQASRQASRQASAHRRSIHKIVLAGSLIAGALALGGCANHSSQHFAVGSTTDHYKTRHPIIIDEKELTHDVPVARDSYDLPLSHASAVEGFGDRFLTSASGRILVMVPNGSANQAAARRIADKVVATLEKRGIPSHRVQMVSYDAHQHGATAPVRLSYSAIKASVEGCGRWTKDLTSSGENKNYHNFGCATQNNLASMIANPADLLGPRGMSSVDAARRGDVIEKYRSGESTSTSDDFATIETIY